MVRMIGVAFLVFFFLFPASAQLKSPEDFLGYPLGSRYTPHWKIVSYFEHVAAQVPGRVKLEPYGETNEGRPLLLSVISSEENMSTIESIRLNNQRLANLASDRMAAIEENMPAIVWLSYNVHGNEPASAEAALLTIYALVNPSDTRTREWLKNTVVIIDPCLNPDGRDRYVNWFHSVSGKPFNPLPMAREHVEPWPQGRSNHYYFDLNRDWAWQTQVESRQRMKKYLDWMPQVHVDYHEQGINEPYFFAPAAEPLHEVITPWQREFQHTIGKNNARYFDQRHWLYFTKILFDLFYPSYGDTYPMFNGAIGMTYEQGGISGGLGVIKEEGDTLTLTDRVMHHFTTSLSTVEAASRDAAKLVMEFRRYFNEAVSNGVGEYKSYLIKYEPGAAQRIDKLLELLDKNGIRYSTATGSGKGYHYFTGKEENFTITDKDILVSAFQPRSALVKVLFEPRSKLSDSVTYDITAWSLPYVYGLRTYASRDKIPAAGPWVRSNLRNPETAYGYVLPWQGLRSARAVGAMLQAGILLRYAETTFELAGKKFERGSILVLQTSNQLKGNLLWNKVRQIADANQVELVPVNSGMVDRGFDFGSDKVHVLKAPRIYMITGETINANAAGAIWSFFEQELGYPLTQINASDIRWLNWNDVDVLIMPEGNYPFLGEKDPTEAFKEWIQKGGRVLALETAVGQLAKAEIGLKVKKTEMEDNKYKASSTEEETFPKFETRHRDAITNFIPGAIYKVELDNTHPLAFGYPGYYFTLKMNDHLYEFLPEGGWNVGVIRKESQVAGFVGKRVKEKLKDGLLFGVQGIGRGAVILLSDDLLFRNFWENGKLMFCNALFFTGLQ